MNWDQIEGKWKQAKGAIKQKWGKLTSEVYVGSEMAAEAILLSSIGQQP